MSSPGQSSGTTKAADHFEDLWRQLGECHQNALQELEAKVSKLKKDRCLDAQRLEVFYTRNQQLKEQNKALQDAISLLEERLRTGECDRCAILEENLKSNQDQNLKLIAKLKNERNSLEDENRKLNAELQKLKMSRSEPQETSSLEDEDSIIPDSPVMPSSLPVVNKLKKRKSPHKVKRVRYAEMPLLQSNNSLFNELIKDPVGASKRLGRTEVLVPNTCELDAPQISNVNEERFVAETCGFELHTEMETAASPQGSTKTSWKHDDRSKPHRPSRPSTLMRSPDSTSERSPSLLPRVKRFSEDSSICTAKRKKDGSDPEVEEDSKIGVQEGAGKQKQPTTPVSSLSFKREPLDGQGPSEHTGTSSQKSNVSCVSPAFKKPNVKIKGDTDGKRRTSLQDMKSSQRQPEAKDPERKRAAEPTWSIDPALALSMYDTECRGDEEMEEQQHHELADTDCTWVSHSLLQAQHRGDGVPGLGEKANDSLDMLFETTTYGEYKSYNSSQLGQSQPCEDDDDYEEEEEEEEEDNEENPHEATACRNKAGIPTFAHVAVVRKKDERRKLKGTTCKECEIYYAHLPEEEKQKKLSACSRHRFRYIPPCTPENFWEVGFPSTQTCIERGYIKEEKNPQARLRRRQPLNALFSPKLNEQESQSCLN